MFRSSTLLSWLTLAFALLLWAGVAMFAWKILQGESERDTMLIQVQETESAQTSLLKLRALARETVEERAKLDEFADRDIVEVLDVVESVSRDAKIPVKIGESLSANVLESSKELKRATLVVEAQGTFNQVVHAAALLESLPLPSAFTELHFEELPIGADSRSRTPQWRVVARLTIITSAEL